MSEQKEENIISIISVHSQKGGVGKSSVASAICYSHNIFKDQKVLLIDADMTGVSLLDEFTPPTNKEIKFLNKYLLLNPYEYQNFNITEYIYEDSKLPNFFILPSSPIYNDIQQIIPILSQEDYTHFIRYRFENLIKAAFEHDFKTIVIDHPPGLFGLTNSTLNLLIGPNKLKSNAFKVDSKLIFITSEDKSDYLSLFPSLSSAILKFKKKDLSELTGKLSVIINKSKSRIHASKQFMNLMKNVSKLKPINSDKRDVNKEIKVIIKNSAAKSGAVGNQLISNFTLNHMRDTFHFLKKPGAKVTSEMGMWCNAILSLLGIKVNNII